MGYTTTKLQIDELKKGLWESVGFYLDYLRTTSTTFIDVFKQTVDFTDIDYLGYGFRGVSDGTFTIDIDIGAVNKVSESGSDSRESGKIDCTSISGEQVLQVEIKRTGGSYAYIRELSLWSIDT